MHGSWRIILVIALAAAVYLVGNARTSLWDRDEPRYAECSRQMLQSGDWVVPRLYEEIRPNKPPFIYWCQATAMRMIGDGPVSGTFAARLPSSIAMVLTLILLAVTIKRHVDGEHAFWTIFVFCTSLMTVIAAKVCLTDSVLLLWATIAQLAVYAIWRGSRSWTVVFVLAVAMALGSMTKPMILLTVGGTVVILGIFAAIGKIRPDPTPIPIKLEPRSIATTITQILVGALIIAVITLPWLYLVRHRAPEFLHKAAAEARAHLETGKEGHNFPPGFHVLLIWVTFFPWSLLLPMAIGLGMRYRRDPPVRFALAAVIGPWLVLEFFGTKLPHYILAIFPSLAFLTANAIIHSLRGDDRDWKSRPFIVGTACWSIATVCVGLAFWLPVPWFHIPGIRIPKFSSQPYAALVLFTIISIAYAILAFTFVKIRKLNAAMLTLGGGMLLLCAIVFGLYFPGAPFLQTSFRVAALLRRIGATQPDQVDMADYKEPSLGFYQGGTIREQKSGFLQVKHEAEWGHWLVTTRDAWDKAPPESRSHWRLVADPQNPFRGWAYADAGGAVELMVLERVPSTQGGNTPPQAQVHQ